MHIPVLGLIAHGEDKLSCTTARLSAAIGGAGQLASLSFAVRYETSQPPECARDLCEEAAARATAVPTRAAIALTCRATAAAEGMHMSCTHRRTPLNPKPSTLNPKP